MVRVLASDGLEPKAIEELNNLGIDVVDKFYEIEELEEQIKDFDAIVVRSATKVRKNVIDKALETKELKLIIRGGVGVDNIDVSYAEENGIKVYNTPNASSASVAEVALAHMFCLARFLNDSNVTMREGKWNKKKYVGVELAGKTLGIVGLGRIGRELALKANALGMNVIYYDALGAIEGLDSYKYVSFNELIEKADFISLHISGAKPIITKTEIDRMKDGTFLINCARGNVVDEKDLLNALNNGKLAGAGLDVFCEEPTKNFELIDHPKVSVTPHIGASTKEAQERIGEEIVRIIKNYFNL